MVSSGLEWCTNDEPTEGLFLLATKLVVHHGQGQHGKINMESDAAVAANGWTFYHYSVIPLLLITLTIAYFTRPKIDFTGDITPAFRSHRYRFLLVWAIAVSADWLQGPYVFALYNSYGYSNSDINKLFVAGFGSSMVCSTFIGSLVDAWGRKRTALAYCILYIVSCMTKHSDNYGALMFGRVTGGIATSLLFSVFECWMVSESNERNQFPPALLRYMFSLMYFVNYIAAILAGLVAQAFVSAIPMRRIPGTETLHYGGNICPFDLAILMLCIAFPLICFTWGENYGSTDESGPQQTASEAFVSAWRFITSSWRVGVIGIVVACFEGSMYAFVINWTPTLMVEGAPPPPCGLIFSAMMMCCMVGSSVFSFFNPNFNPAKVLVTGCIVSAAAFGLVATEIGSASLVAAMYTAFLLFEFCVGLYFPAMGSLKSELVPEESRAGVYNWYRLPLNAVVCSIILTDLPLRTAFTTCALLLVAAAVSILPVAITPLPTAHKPQALRLG